MVILDDFFVIRLPRIGVAPLKKRPERKVGDLSKEATLAQRLPFLFADSARFWGEIGPGTRRGSLKQASKHAKATDLIKGACSQESQMASSGPRSGALQATADAGK